MNYDKISHPSTMVESTLPGYIREQYEKFVKFLELANQSEERLGFSKDILQNLQVYRDFDTYAKPINEFTTLAQKINETSSSTEGISFPELQDSAKRSFKSGHVDYSRSRDRRVLAGNIEEPLVLTNGDGFPLENGVILIGDEVILYRYRKGNVLHDLLRGASATTILGTFLKESTYKKTEPQQHYTGDIVHNLSAMFMAAILEVIHKTYCQPIAASRVAKPIDRSAVLENIKDFFQSKGTKLGVKALFKILFAENDVDVFYPGDRMIIPSKSTWYEGKLLRLVPVPFNLSDQAFEPTVPTRLIGNEMILKSYNDNLEYGRITIDYASQYEFETEIQYEIFVQSDNVVGSTIANPKTKLTRNLKMYGTHDDDQDVDTITVETTLGFPDSGVLIINKEAIRYESKSFNQFFGCKRGYIGVDQFHLAGDFVYGPYYYEGTATKDGVEYLSRAFPLGLVDGVDIYDPGLLHELTDQVNPDGPGRIDPREPIMGSFRENYDDFLVFQSDRLITLNYVGNITAGVSGIYFDDKHVFVSSSTLPHTEIGPFSTQVYSVRDNLVQSRTGNVDEIVGPHLLSKNNLSVIPRRNEIKENGQITSKGTDTIGIFADGVPAYSNISPYRVTQGKITKYTILNGGINYITPTLVVDDQEVDETITVVDGVIIDITTDDNTDRLTSANARISSGEGADISFYFDKFGRIVNALVNDGGRFYKDTPVLTAVDSSGRGKGAVFSVTVENGSITDVKIIHPGIDYNKVTTYGLVKPIGSEADIESSVQFYQFDRYYEIVNTKPDWRFDEGGGFLFEDANMVKSSYGYLADPFLLEEYLGNHESGHSPLMGYAFDGNPIYGPYGYRNKVDDTDGITHYRSSYVLRESREGIIASDGNQIGTLPPDEGEYPMGTFVEDYYHSIEDSLDKIREKLIINSEVPEKLKTQDIKWLAYGILPDKLPDGTYPGLLDEYNSVVCNTPEYPKELYPEGVRCYFLSTVREGEPEFPYIIGHTFYNRPISQNILVREQETIQPLFSNSYETNRSYDETPLVFDYDHVERFRNYRLSSTKEELELEISDTLDGSISEVLVQNGLPTTSKVGDYVYFNNDETGGGGAQARVSFITGENVTNAVGKDIVTYVISHVQIINIGSCTHLDSDGNVVVDGDGNPSKRASHVFTKGSIIQTSSGAKSIVLDYDPIDEILTVKTFSKNLILYGDVFRDNKRQLILIPSIERFDAKELNDYILYTEDEYQYVTYEDDEIIKIVSRVDDYDDYQLPSGLNDNNRVYFSVIEPDVDSDNLTAGDLWWSNRTGRLYVFFVDEDGTRQWVCNQPTGMIPMEGALDVGTGNNEPTTPMILTPQEDLIVTISTMAPSERTDGSPNRYGDFWWSPHTGIMYMWYEEQWVGCTPNGKVPTIDALDIPNYYTDDREHNYRHRYETSLTVIISLLSPFWLPDGSPLKDGVLWWSPITGKMYIRYTDDLGNSCWAITNPIAMMPNQYASDTSTGEGDNTYPPLKPGPEEPDIGADPELANIAGINYIWFEHLKHFFPSDDIMFYQGAPGTSANEFANILAIVEGGAPAAALIKRGDPTITLYDGTPTYNKTRSLYTVTTDTPHKVRTGDTVRIYDSIYDELNGFHEVIEGGTIVPAKARTVIANGQVSEVIIEDPGKYYRENFYIAFYGGGGVGGYAYVEVNPLMNPVGDPGSIRSITVEYGGIHYREEAKIKWPEQIDETQFSIYTSKTYGTDPNIRYSSNSKYAMNTVDLIEVTGNGYQYERLPSITGLYKKYIDRAETEIELNGTSIFKVKTLYGGSRYENPIAVFSDYTGNGSGAEADVVVENGKVQYIVVRKGGSGYVEPVLTLVEADGKYLPLTTDIGKIKAFDIINPGRQISPDRSLKPELQITTRIIIFDIEGTFYQDDKVYQGIPDYHQVDAVVVDYDDARQMLTLDYVDGVLKHGEKIYSSSGASATVVLQGEADCRVEVGGISSPKGDFLDDTSKVSEMYPCIQDSYYFQWFSYVISSPIQQQQYEAMVNNVIHPAGFVMFSDLTIHDFTVAQYRSDEVVFL